MLTELRVRDLAVIADVTLPFQPGLNVLTGETGAGKSMVVDALSLLLGERASADIVRPGADSSVLPHGRRPRAPPPSRAAPETVVTTVPTDGSSARPASSRLSPCWS